MGDGWFVSQWQSKKNIFAKIHFVLQFIKSSTFSIEKQNLSNNCTGFTYHSERIFFFYVFLSSGWRCLSETVWLTVTLSLSSSYLRWQRERRHTARAVLLPVFNNTGWLRCTDTAESGLKRSDHLLMHMKCDKEGMITNLWMNGRRDCVEHKQIHTVWRWRWSPPSDGMIRVTFTSHYQTRIGIK